MMTAFMVSFAFGDRDGGARVGGVGGMGARGRLAFVVVEWLVISELGASEK